MAEKGKMGNQSSGGNSKQRRAERRAQKPTTINNNSTTKKTHSTIKSESLSNAASMSIERQNLGREKVGKLIQSGGGAIALIIASLTGAIQISGVISMEVAYLLIAVAWLTFVAAIYTSERLLSASNKHTARVILIAGILSGVILFGFAFWLAFKKAEIDKKADKPKLNIQKMSDAELKSEVAAFVKSLHEFDQKMRAAEPDLFYQKLEELRAAKTEEEKRRVTERYSKLEGRTRVSWTLQRINEYNQQYYTRAEELRDEMYRRIPPKNLDGIKPVPYNGLAGPNPIGEIASNLEKLSNLMPN